MVGQLYLKYTRGLPDEKIFEWCLDSPNVQYLCEETHF